MGLATWEGSLSFWVGEGTRAEAAVNEDLTEIGWSAEVESERFFWETLGSGVQERVW